MVQRQAGLEEEEEPIQTKLIQQQENEEEEDQTKIQRQTGKNDGVRYFQAVRELHQGFLIWDKTFVFDLKLS